MAIEVFDKKIILNEGEIRKGLLIEQDAGSVNGIVNTINEAEIKDDDGVERIIIECILQRAGVLNRNGRIYPKHILEREVNKFMNLISNNSSFNAVDHPDSSIVSLKRDELSHIITECWWKGDDLYGKLELITTRAYYENGSVHCAGDHIANLIRRKYKLGISSRGLGSLKNIGGKHMVQDDFELICFDIVASPSTPNAYLYPEGSNVMNESVIVGENNILQQKIKNFIKNK